MNTKQPKKYSPIKHIKPDLTVKQGKGLQKRTAATANQDVSGSFSKVQRRVKVQQPKSITSGIPYVTGQGKGKTSLPPSNHRANLSMNMKVTNCYSRSTAASISGSYCISNISNISANGKIVKEDDNKQLEEQATTEYQLIQKKQKPSQDTVSIPTLIRPTQCSTDVLDSKEFSPSNEETKTLTKTLSQNRIQVMTQQSVPASQNGSKPYIQSSTPSYNKKATKTVPNSSELQIIPHIKFQRKRQSTLSSFKESFNESENFLNVEEKMDLENKSANVELKAETQQKSLKQLIKEKFLGPILSEHGQNSDSLLKRNILVTSSNLSSGVESNVDSMASSFKSSFIIMQAARGAINNPCNTRLSYNKNKRQSYSPNNIDADYINLDDTDEGLNDMEEKTLDKIQDYNFQPKSMFSEDSTPGKKLRQQNRDSPQVSNSNQKHNNGKMGAFVSQVKQGQMMQPIQMNPPRVSDIPSPTTEDNQQPDDIVDFLQSDTHKLHLIQTLQSLQYIKNHLKNPPMDEIKRKRVTLPRNKKPGVTKTLVFDLDETLVHCVEDFENKPVDQMITVTFPNGETATAGLNFRPYLQECLKRASELFQVVVFTASHKSYADVVLDIIDPDRTIFDLRLYRDSCIRTPDGVYVKDLRIFHPSRRIEDIIIVDNAVYSFGYQLENGIPIIPFYQDKEDVELLHLIQYLECLLKNGGDVRGNNQKAFQLRELSELDVQQFFQNLMNEGQEGSQEAQEQQEEENNTHNQSWDEERQLRNLRQQQYEIKTEVINEESNEEDESQNQDVQVNCSRKSQKQTHQRKRNTLQQV